MSGLQWKLERDVAGWPYLRSEPDRFRITKIVLAGTAQYELWRSRAHEDGPGPIKCRLSSANEAKQLARQTDAADAAANSIAWQPHTHARRGDPDTSHAAAASLHNAAAVCEVIHASLRAVGPAHNAAIAARTGLDPWAVSKRLSDLKNAGRIADTGRQDKGPSGRMQTVWKAIENPCREGGESQHPDEDQS